MKTSSLRYPEPVTIGPHLDQTARDLLDDNGLLHGGDRAGLGDAMEAQAVTAS